MTWKGTLGGDENGMVRGEVGERELRPLVPPTIRADRRQSRATVEARRYGSVCVASARQTSHAKGTSDEQDVVAQVRRLQLIERAAMAQDNGHGVT